MFNSPSWPNIANHNNNSDCAGSGWECNVLTEETNLPGERSAAAVAQLKVEFLITSRAGKKYPNKLRPAPKISGFLQ